MSKGRRGTMKRTSWKIFKLEQKSEKLWTISRLPELQVRAHEIHLCFTSNLLILHKKKAQLRFFPVSLQWLFLPSSSFRVLERGNTLKTRLEKMGVDFLCFVVLLPHFKTHGYSLGERFFANWFFLRSCIGGILPEVTFDLWWVVRHKASKVQTPISTHIGFHFTAKSLTSNWINRNFVRLFF